MVESSMMQHMDLNFDVVTLDLRRGRPLFLHQQRYADLRQLFLSHSLLHFVRNNPPPFPMLQLLRNQQ